METLGNSKIRTKKCVAKQCDSFWASDLKHNLQINMHCFPRAIDQQLKWLEACDRLDLRSIPSKNLCKNYFLCSKHFSSNCYDAQGRRLKRNMIPNLQLALQNNNKNMLQQDKELMSPFQIGSFASAIHNAFDVDNDFINDNDPVVDDTTDRERKYHGSQETSLRPLVELPESKGSFNLSSACSTTKNDESTIVEGNLGEKISKQSTSTQTIWSKQIYTDRMQLNCKNPRKKKLKIQIYNKSRYKKRKDLKLTKLVNKLKKRKKKITEVRKFNDLESVPSFTSELYNVTLNRKKNYSEKFKEQCLQIYQSSPKSYKIIRKLTDQHLPSIETLCLFLNSRVHCPPGINLKLFGQLEEIVSRFVDPKAKYVTLLIDEMSLMKNLEWDVCDNELYGTEDLGNGLRSPKLATSACVAMVRGISSNFAQPIGYVFTNGPAKAQLLHYFVSNVLSALFKIGLVVVCCTTDQSPTMQNYFGDELKVTIDRPYFHFEDHKIVYLSDPPHLIKSARNCLKGDTVKTSDGSVKWTTFQESFMWGKQNNLKSLFSKGVEQSQQTIAGVKVLLEELMNYGFEHLYTRRLCKDSLEHCFADIRSSSENNLDPTCKQFKYSFRKVVCGALIKISQNRNGEFDHDIDVLLKLVNANEDANIVLKDYGLTDISMNSMKIPFHITDVNNKDERCGMYFVAGSICRTLLKAHPNSNCSICKLVKINTDHDYASLPTHFVDIKQYDFIDASENEGLFDCSQEFFLWFIDCEKLFSSYFAHHYFDRNFFDDITAKLSQVNFNFCSMNIKATAIEQFVLLRTRYMLKFYNCNDLQESCT